HLLLWTNFEPHWLKTSASNMNPDRPGCYLHCADVLAVNNFKKDLGCGKSQRTMSAATQSQNTAPKPSPVLTLTPPTVQNKIKKPLQSPCTEQVNSMEGTEQLQTACVTQRQSSSRE
ncbi:hypothetical protein XENOCAPTIV_011017, partial [Xenoophorus captivus]